MARPSEPQIDKTMPRNPMVNIAGDFTAPEPEPEEVTPSERLTATGQSTLGNEATEAGKYLRTPKVDFPVDE